MARDPGLDAARALAMMLVVATHAALSFMVTPIGWAIQDRSQHLGVDVFVWTMRACGMPAFFWLSGYFSRSVYVRRGVAGFVRHRVLWILIPLAIAIVPCSLALDALWDWGRELALRPSVAAAVPKLEASKLPLTLGHLWYLYYLLVLSAAAIVVVEVARRLRITAPRGNVVMAATVAIAFGALAHAGMLQLDTPLGFGVDVRTSLYFGAFFAWGWLIHADRAQLQRYAARVGWWLGAAALSLAAVMPALAAGQAPLYATAASAAFTAAMVAAFLGGCVRFARHSHAVIRLASDASYWIYIVHLPLVVLLQIWLAPVALPGPIKYIAIFATTATVCLVSYAAAARARSWLGASRRPADTAHPAPRADTP
jgi:glucans biosynthesis protein C